MLFMKWSLASISNQNNLLYNQVDLERIPHIRRFF